MPDGLLPWLVGDGERIYAGKSLTERVTGRFYTPDPVAEHLVDAILSALSKRSGWLNGTLRVADPFCGDGRLVGCLLRGLAERAARDPGRTFDRIDVRLQDCDPVAVRSACLDIERAALAFGLDVTVDAEVCDSFLGRIPEGQDVVLTNPPWEVLKPDRRETAGMPARRAAEYGAWLEERSDQLLARFPQAASTVGFGRWTVSLARCGLELAVRAADPGGLVGIVLPAPILADQASEGLRRSVLERATLIDLSVFPAEARAFSKVDQTISTLVLDRRGEGGVNADLTIHDRTCAVELRQHLVRDADQLAKARYALPVGFGARSLEVLDTLGHLPTFQDLEAPGREGLWAGRELDETGLDQRLVASGRHPFVKGRMVGRNCMVTAPDRFVDLSRFRPTPSVAFSRLVWRDISRPSQKRRMIATLIPPGWIAGNTLHVAHFRDGDEHRLEALLAVLGSLVFELQVRSRLATGHMSLGVVRRSHVPVLKGDAVGFLSAAARAALRGEREAGIALEVGVAKAYGLSRDAFAAVASEFPKLDGDEREALLGRDLWL